MNTTGSQQQPCWHFESPQVQNHVRPTQANQWPARATSKASRLGRRSRATPVVDVGHGSTHSQSFLIHLNVARQCHHIAFHQRMHVSRWKSEQCRQHINDQEWNRRFKASLPNDVLLLWNVFRMPCLHLVNIGHYSATHPGGLKDIVHACEPLIDTDQPLPHAILTA